MQNLSVHQHFGIHFFTFWYTLFYILVYTFFISLYLFNTATDRVYFWHACTLGPGLYSPNVFGDAALINYANLCKICQSVSILVLIHFFTFWYTLFFIGLYLFNTATDRFIFGMHVPLDQTYTVLMFLVTLPSLIMLIYANLVKIT